MPSVLNIRIIITSYFQWLTLANLVTMHFLDVSRQKHKKPNIFIAYSISDRFQFWNDFEEQWTINNIAINFG
ncbi:hypothetical protein T4B_3235 [Trichinella pseudospiralis]|uniref:Uncharacterized protein n=1 Tax=Trichinella pseudospiralis TaxID=6337 RepID=A0A0V1JG60_TRIPS|nr:hypothetical protein T4B_3235 [Trichinella pseudospiralis]